MLPTAQRHLWTSFRCALPPACAIAVLLCDSCVLCHACRCERAQTAYQVLVGRSSAEVVSGRGTVWDSGVVATSQSIGVAVPAGKLQSFTEYWWTVRVRHRSTRRAHGPGGGAMHCVCAAERSPTSCACCVPSSHSSGVGERSASVRIRRWLRNISGRTRCLRNS